MDSKIVKTKCDWCGKEMPCPKDRLKEKQACLKCFSAKTGEMAKIPVGKLHVGLRPDNVHELADFIGQSIIEE